MLPPTSSSSATENTIDIILRSVHLAALSLYANNDSYGLISLDAEADNPVQEWPQYSPGPLEWPS